MSSRRGDLAIIPCRNGGETANKILEDLKIICGERKAILNKKNNSFNLYELRQKEFIEHSEKHKLQIITPEIKDFKDGEISIKITESVRGKDVYIVQNTLDPENPEKTSHNILELILMIETVRRSSASYITIVLPYLSYSKQERRQGRQPISAKVLLDLLSTNADKLITMDLHAPAIEGFTGAKHLNIENLFSSSIIIDYLINQKKFKGTFLAPDAGAAKMVGHYSKVTGFPLAVSYKIKKPDSYHEPEEQKLLGEVENHDVVIIDDQIATGPTTLKIAKTAKEKGAKKVFGAVTHGMLLGDAEKKFSNAIKQKIIDGLIITNTLIHSKEFLNRNPYITQLDALKMFSLAIFETQVDGSISSLYGTKLRESMFGENHKALN